MTLFSVLWRCFPSAIFVNNMKYRYIIIHHYKSLSICSFTIHENRWILATLLFRSTSNSFLCWKDAESYYNTSVALLPLNLVYLQVFSFYLGLFDTCILCTSMALCVDCCTLRKQSSVSSMWWLVWTNNISWHLSVNICPCFWWDSMFNSRKRIFDCSFIAATLKWGYFTIICLLKSKL